MRFRFNPKQLPTINWKVFNDSLLLFFASILSLLWWPVFLVVLFTDQLSFKVLARLVACAVLLNYVREQTRGVKNGN